MERNSKRRQVKPPETLLRIEDLGESSDDSDFRIEDHCLDESGSSDSSEASDTSKGKLLIVFLFEVNSFFYLLFFFELNITSYRSILRN